MISAAIFQSPCHPLLGIRGWLSVVSGRYRNQRVRDVLFLEELALPKNRCSHQSLCCDSTDRRIGSCHGDCRRPKSGQCRKNSVFFSTITLCVHLSYLVHSIGERLHQITVFTVRAIKAIIRLQFV